MPSGSNQVLDKFISMYVGAQLELSNIAVQVSQSSATEFATKFWVSRSKQEVLSSLSALNSPVPLYLLWILVTRVVFDY